MLTSEKTQKWYSVFKTTYNQNVLGVLYMLYPDKGIVKMPKLDNPPNVENLTIHSPEPIPKSPN